MEYMTVSVLGKMNFVSLVNKDMFLRVLALNQGSYCLCIKYVSWKTINLVLFHKNVIYIMVIFDYGQKTH